ncbi:MAG: cytochrome c oxidase subunit II [Hyphomonadaceae bacterium]
MRSAFRNLVLSAIAVAATSSAWAQTNEMLVGQPTPGAMGMQPAATEIAEKVHSFHTLVLVIITAITIFVMGLLLWIIVFHNRRANPTPKKFSHNTPLEIAWTVIPVLILVVIAYRSFPLLFDEETSCNDPNAMYVKVTGYQWYWGYGYDVGQDSELTFDSNMIPEDAIDVSKGQVDKLSVDNPLVVPQGRCVRLDIVANDVIHSFAVPAFAIKVDAIPGRVNESWFKVDKAGSYFGQCSELCGTRHAYMPIEIRVVSPEQYDIWRETAANSLSDARTFLEQIQAQNVRIASAQ